MLYKPEISTTFEVFHLPQFSRYAVGRRGGVQSSCTSGEHDQDENSDDNKVTIFTHFFETGRSLEIRYEANRFYSRGEVLA